METSTWLLALVGLITSFSLLMIHRFSYWRKRGVSGPKPSAPFGNFSFLVRGQTSITNGLLELSAPYSDKGFCGVYRWTSPLLLVWDPAMVKQILCKDFSSFHDRGVHHVDEQDPLGSHLFNLTGVKWRNLRNKMTPIFSSGKLKTMYPLVRDIGRQLTTTVASAAHESGDADMDVCPVIARFATDVIGSVAFGVQCNCLRDAGDNEFLAMSRQLFRPSPLHAVRSLLEAIHPMLGHLLPFKWVFSHARRFFLDLMKSTVAHRERTGAERADLVQAMLSLRQADLSRLDANNHVVVTPNVMAAQAFIFFVAGLENVTNTIAFCLNRLAADQALQQAVADEVARVTPAHSGGELSYEELGAMDLLHRVVLEGLRLWGPAGVLFRKCNATTKVGDLIIEEGQTVAILAARMHNDANLFPDPSRFDPDRHGVEASRQRHPYAFVPFGEGPRMCIATRFAMLEMKLALAILVRDFAFTPGPRFESEIVIEPKSSFPKAKNGIWLHLTPRL